MPAKTPKTRARRYRAWIGIGNDRPHVELRKDENTGYAPSRQFFVFTTKRDALEQFASVAPVTITIARALNTRKDRPHAR